MAKRNEELVVLERLDRELAKLSDESRVRVLDWLVAKHGRWPKFIGTIRDGKEGNCTTVSPTTRVAQPMEILKQVPGA